MSPVGDDGLEMFRRNHLDDDTVERLLTHRPVAGQELLVSFVEDVAHATTVPGPMPAPMLASLFAEGVFPDKGDLLVTAGSNVHGPATQAAGLPKRKKRNMIEAVLGKLAALGLAAKLAAATGAIALAGTAIAATGQLPAPAQERVADVAAHVGLGLPGTSTGHADKADTGTTDPTTSTTTHADNHGTEVSTAAQDHSQDELCGNHGKAVSAVATGKTSCVDTTTSTTQAGATTSTTEAQGDDHGKADQHNPTGSDANSDTHKPGGDATPTTTTSIPTGNESGNTHH